MPITKLAEADFDENNTIGVLELVCKCGFAASKSEARRLIQQGGAEAAGVKINDIYKRFAKEEFANGLILKKGKKAYTKVAL